MLATNAGRFLHSSGSASGRKQGKDIAAFIFPRFRLELAARSRASGMEKPASPTHHQAVSPNKANRIPYPEFGIAL
jgi:hypothetical protein